MTAYEFTRFESDYTSKAKAGFYDANIIASLLEQRNSGKDLRKQPEYKEADFVYFELTGSCDRQEAMSWMKYWMANAIAYGIQTGDTKWGYFFLAAYDLMQEL